MKPALLFGLTLILAATSPIETASNAEPTVAIRTYNYARVPADRLARARSAADIILKTAGISLQWIDCRVPQGDAGAACTEPLGERRDLILRLMDRAPALDKLGPSRVHRGPSNLADSDRILPLGTSMLDREQRGGVLMTVDLFPVRTIAEEAVTDLPTLLGRAIAHEIGHLLLGTAEHPRTGLMRAFWSQDELRGVKPASWRFSPQEAAQMRHGLTARARAAN